MYLYLFKGGVFLEEMFVTNYNEFELEILIRELKDKNGDVDVLISAEQIEEPTVEKVKEQHAVA